MYYFLFLPISVSKVVEVVVLFLFLLRQMESMDTNISVKSSLYNEGSNVSLKEQRGCNHKRRSYLLSSKYIESAPDRDIVDIGYLEFWPLGYWIFGISENYFLNLR